MFFLINHDIIAVCSGFSNTTNEHMEQYEHLFTVSHVTVKEKMALTVSAGRKILEREKTFADTNGFSPLMKRK